MFRLQVCVILELTALSGLCMNIHCMAICMRDHSTPPTPSRIRSRADNPYRLLVIRSQSAQHNRIFPILRPMWGPDDRAVSLQELFALQHIHRRPRRCRTASSQKWVAVLRPTVNPSYPVDGVFRASLGAFVACQW